MKRYFVDNINKTVIFEFDFDRDIVSDIKDCGFKARWNPELKQWIVGIDEYSEPRILNVIKTHYFKYCVEGEDVAVEKFDYSISKERADELKNICLEKDFAYEPRDYQLDALHYAIEKGNLINGDDVGVGKSFESILYAEVTDSFPLLIITPASIKYDWKTKYDEITKNKRTVSVIESKETSKRKNNWDADVVIINYDILGKKQGTGTTVKFPQLLDTKWRMIIADEAHMLKTTKSHRYRASRKIMKKGITVQLLTGTASMNKPVELWNLILLTRYDTTIVNNYMQFITRYCGGYKGKFGWVTDGATNIFELNTRLRENCYLRREKVDVLKELPSVTKQIINTTFTKKADYKKAVNNLIDYIRETKGDESAEAAQEAEHLVAISTLRKLAIEGKVAWLKQYLKEWKECNNGKLLVFGIHKEALEELSEMFKCPLIAGGVSSKKKQQIKDDWQDSDDMFLFANMQAGGTGIDGLQNVCSNMLISELPWRPADLEQSIGRLHRSGQKVPVTVTFALAEDTIDMDMWDMLSEKEAITEAVNKGIDVKKNGSGLKAVLKKIIKKGKIK